MNVPQNRKSGVAPAASAPLPQYESNLLFGAGKEIVIRHAGELYRLRVTRQNKLILTK
ncbi:MAG: hemin uptake protein HemP [Pseudomonadota bacterium]